MSTLSKQERIDLFRDLFRGREDVFARRWEKYGGGVSGYAPVYMDWRKKEAYVPLSDAHIERHLTGNATLGVYALIEDNTSRFLVVDFDGDGWRSDARKFCDVCAPRGVPVYVEQSRSGNGAHVWCFFSEPVQAYMSRAVFFRLLREARHIGEYERDDSFDRLFPNQDYLSGKGLGNLIALPLQGKSRKEGNTVFVNPDDDFAVYPDQWEFLTNVKRVSRGEMELLYADGVADSEYGSGKGDARRKGRRAQLRGARNPSAIHITLAHDLTIPKKDVPPTIAAYLRDELNFFNAQYAIKQRMGFSPHGVEKYIRAVYDDDTHVHIPRGWLSNVKEKCAEEGLAVDISDMRSDGARVAYTPSITLRPYQKKAVDTLTAEGGGVLVAPPGAGKTIIGIMAAAKLKRSVLILTHRAQIFNQWIDAAESFLGMPKKDIGRYSGAEKREGKGYVTVAMVQTIARMSDEDTRVLRDRFGMVILDECHHVPARMFRDCVARFNPRYLYGLTATPKRMGNDEKLITAYLGDTAHVVEPADMCGNAEGKSGNAQTLDIAVRETKLSLPFSPKATDMPTLGRIVSHDAERNALISADVRKEVEKGNACLVLTERKEHADVLAWYLRRHADTALFTGDLSGRKRRDTEARIKKGDFDVIVATGHMLGEGADIPALSRLFLAFPFSFEGKLIQYLGRVGRNDLPSRVYDYRDSNIPLLEKKFTARRRRYRKMTDAI